MTEKRFTTDNGSNEDVCLVDNLTKKEYESNFNDIVDLMNKNWEQTQRFEKHNQYLEKENEQLKQQNRELQGELQDEKLGLNLWNAENTILEEEKKQLQKENKELKDKLENGLCPLCGARVSKCGGLQKYKGDFE